MDERDRKYYTDVRIIGTQWEVCAYRVGVDRLSAWPIIGADIKHFTDYRYRPF